MSPALAGETFRDKDPAVRRASATRLVVIAVIHAPMVHVAAMTTACLLFFRQRLRFGFTGF